MATSNISWTDKVWNPVVGCSRVSAGCARCYAETFAARLEAMGQARYQGLTVVGEQGPRWTRQVREVPEALGAPLHWRKGCRVFVNSMSDLFHEGLHFEYIAAVFGVMAACPQHTFQVLTKRPERAVDFFGWVRAHAETNGALEIGICVAHASQRLAMGSDKFMPNQCSSWPAWPLHNVHLGVSVEDQANADKRIPLLLLCPAAVRWVSYEPALGPLGLRRIYFPTSTDGDGNTLDALTGVVSGLTGGLPRREALSWVVSGGESGPNHRPVDPAWIDSVVAQCAEAGVPHFTKQDSGPKPGKQGRLSAETWARKEFPR